MLTSGKMVLLDKLLTRLKETGHRCVFLDVLLILLLHASRCRIYASVV